MCVCVVGMCAFVCVVWVCVFVVCVCVCGGSGVCVWVNITREGSVYLERRVLK